MRRGDLKATLCAVKNAKRALAVAHTRQQERNDVLR